MHWAAALIGRPYREAAQGPEAFDCWGLVRHALRIGYGVDMPLLGVGDQAEGVAAVKRAATGWHQVTGKLPRERDVVLMTGWKKDRHVGLMVASGDYLFCLHASSDIGGVAAQQLRDVARDGYERFELWRMRDAAG